MNVDYKLAAWATAARLLKVIHLVVAEDQTCGVPGRYISKSKGLWLGPWANRSDPPVALDWSSVKIKVLGVFLGPGNLDEDNWKPCIAAVENTLLSWRQHILSFQGRGLVINALALSRVWYVASLIRMPSWVFGELLRLVFSFFWKDKKDLVSRAVVVQAPSVGGFSVVDVKLKVQSLLVQWVRRFVTAQSSWSGLSGFLVSFVGCTGFPFV